ncbi:hypothetical protein QT381_02800 [Galbitalea sp. SE-J8]|uniref:hypothetical protein n=1 Tax=Galbitalea sp. SE-J8 TaxID=3054952 RepID=UPI00259CA18D|nr:hypothetical protein [Galbitalea sp. SE-J8]MDM4761933.1 hypothetical protein [Galbitalea sp. SE-J8]
MTACAELADLADRLARGTSDPREFLVALGREAAGIRPGVIGVADLARGGRNTIPGRGMRAEFDDGTDGQVRHFAGIASAQERLGGRRTRQLAIRLLGDAPDSADGRLSDAAIAFAEGVRDGSIPLTAAGAWIRDHVCGAS